MKRRIDTRLRTLAYSLAERLMSWAQRPNPYTIVMFPNGTAAVSPATAAGTIVAFAKKLGDLCPHLDVDSGMGRSRCGGAVLSIMVHHAGTLAEELARHGADAPADEGTGDGDLLAYAREKARAAWAQAAGGSES